jgi:hypothetical protein
MPRISPRLLDTTFYLYRNEEDAAAGHKAGGTGFLVAYWPPADLQLLGKSPPRKTRVTHVYAVTNWHVACRGCSIVRLNTVDGRTEIFAFDPSDWKFLKGADDVAAIRIPVDRTKHRFNAIETQRLVKKPPFTSEGIGPGDDVFMVGRFIDHDGGITNQPAVRFGHISMLPAPIYLDELRRERDYYCVDLHSRTGFSGSPVFVYRTIGQDLDGADIAALIRKLQQGRDLPFWELRPMFALLGIHCAQFPEAWELKSKKGKPTNEYVMGMSGMTMVAPSWAILETLEHPDLQQERKELDAGAPEPPAMEPILESSNSPVAPRSARRRPARKR